MNNKAISLIELIIVIVIIGIIGAFAVPAVGRYLTTAKLNKISNDVSVIDEAADLFYLDTGQRPKGSVSGVGTCELWNLDSYNLFQVGESNNLEIAGWNGPYIENWPETSPFGGCYVYRNYEVGAQSWARSNWLHITTNETINTVAPLDEDIEIIMIRFYPIDDENQLELSREVAQFLLDRFDNNVYYVNNQAVIGIYIKPN